jgi:ABC-type Fe3+-hydroxamate transport system substrate-binding protein
MIAPILYQDMMHRSVWIPAPPKRIISLVPSQTELLFDLGLDATVVGITKFCEHPHHWWQSKKRVGGTKKLQLKAIAALEPDLIIANKEENTQAEIEQLATAYPVWISDIQTIEQGLEMITALGQITHTIEKANAITHQIRQSFEQLSKSPKPLKVAYLIWANPWMSVGKDTFIHAMLEHAGYSNVFAAHERYPSTTIEELAQKAPDLIFLSSEPFPFKEKHRQSLQKLLPHAQIILVDGTIFSWYGSRMQHAAAYLEKLQQQYKWR